MMSTISPNGWWWVASEMCVEVYSSPRRRKQLSIALRLSGGHGTSLMDGSCLFGATLTGSPFSSLTWAIQQVSGVKPNRCLTQFLIAAYVAILLIFRHYLVVRFRAH